MDPNIVATFAQAVGLPIIVAALISFLLTRRGANKKLELDERTVSASEFEKQLQAYRDLLDRGDALVLASTADVHTLKEKVAALEAADEAKSGELDNANRKIEMLRKLFQSYVERTGVPLTPEEQDVFDNTMPSPRLARGRN